jgi:hypothetical protein
LKHCGEVVPDSPMFDNLAVSDPEPVTLPSTEAFATGFTVG